MDKFASVVIMKEELKEMEYNNKSGEAKWIGTPECIEIKVEQFDKEAEALKERAIEKIGSIEKDEDGAIFGQDFVDGEVNHKMENSDDDIFQEMVNDIKLEGTKFEAMDVPSSIDIKDNLIVTGIKHEELIIKSESGDTCEENMYQGQRNLDIRACLRSTAKLQHGSVMEIEMFSCGECGYRTKYKSNLKQHNVQHKKATEIEMFHCGHCDYQSKLKHNLQRHMLRHKSSKQVEMFSCGECTFQTKYQSSLKAHMLRHKSPSEIEMFSSGECEY